MEKTEFSITFFDFDSLDQLPINPKPNHFRLESNVTVSTNLKALWENIVRNKTALSIAFILHDGEKKNREIISTNFRFSET